jgi:hypothetical protein
MRAIGIASKLLPLTVMIWAAASTTAAAQSWTAPQVVGTVPYLTGGAVATNGSTSAVVFAAGVSTLNQFEIQAVVRTGGVWGSPAVLETPFLYAVNFSVAVAPNGDVLAAWRYDATTAADSGVAQVALYTAGHWGTPLTISTAGLNAGVPSIAFDGQSLATVVWEQTTSSSSCALKAIRSNAAHSFGAAQSIAGSCYGFVNLAVNSVGQAVVSQGASGIKSGPIVAVSRDSSGSWAAPVTLASSVYRQRQPKVGLGNEGTAVVVWLTNAGVSYANRSNGTWSAAAPLPGVLAGRAGGISGVAVDAGGNALATFTLTSLTPGVFATFRPVQGTWQAPVQLPAGPIPVKATPSGTFVVGSGGTVATRPAGSTNWSSTEFTNDSIVDVAAGTGSAIVTLAGVAPNSIAVSTEKVP